MGTITAVSLIAKAQELLLDTAEARWTQAELLGYLNDGQRQIAQIRPDASVANANVTLIAGTKQAIPAVGLRILDVVRNMGSDGATPGKPITLIDREMLDLSRPNWHTESQSAAIKHYAYDQRNPRNFYVYPPALVDTKVEAVYSVSPANVAAVGDPITLDDIYADCLLDWMLYRAFSKETEQATGVQHANMHLQTFMATLGQKIQTDIATGPNKNAPPIKPALQGAR